jgi:hypothetical protein
MRPHDLKQALRAGPYAWPGGYPLFFLTADGSVLSFAAVREELRQVLCAVRQPGTDPWWEIVAIGTNWEEPDLCCEHTGQLIPCAYPED